MNITRRRSWWRWVWKQSFSKLSSIFNRGMEPSFASRFFNVVTFGSAMGLGVLVDAPFILMLNERYVIWNIKNVLQTWCRDWGVNFGTWTMLPVNRHYMEWQSLSNRCLSKNYLTYTMPCLHQNFNSEKSNNTKLKTAITMACLLYLVVIYLGGSISVRPRTRLWALHWLWTFLLGRIVDKYTSCNFPWDFFRIILYYRVPGDLGRIARTV
jgi:hypothetical protein